VGIRYCPIFGGAAAAWVTSPLLDVAEGFEAFDLLGTEVSLWGLGDCLTPWKPPDEDARSVIHVAIAEGLRQACRARWIDLDGGAYRFDAISTDENLSHPGFDLETKR